MRPGPPWMLSSAVAVLVALSGRLLLLRFRVASLLGQPRPPRGTRLPSSPASATMRPRLSGLSEPPGRELGVPAPWPGGRSKGTFGIVEPWSHRGRAPPLPAVPSELADPRRGPAPRPSLSDPPEGSPEPRYGPPDAGYAALELPPRPRHPRGEEDGGGPDRHGVRSRPRPGTTRRPNPGPRGPANDLPARPGAAKRRQRERHPEPE